jgi:hypothetical protein
MLSQNNSLQERYEIQDIQRLTEKLPQAMTLGSPDPPLRDTFSSSRRLWCGGNLKTANSDLLLFQGWQLPQGS